MDYVEEETMNIDNTDNSDSYMLENMSYSE